MVEFVSSQKSLLFKPGYDYAYSNTAYVLLSEIIQQISKKSYSEYIKQTILDPLGMNDTFIIDNPNIKIEDKAIGYTNENEWQTNDYENIQTTGPGGMYSTTGNLYLWFKSIIENRFISKNSKELIFNSPITVSGKKSYMLMGWFDETFGRKTPELQGLEVYGAIGILKGFRSSLHLFPHHEFVVIVLSNSGTFPIHSHDVAKLYFKRVEN